MKMLKRELAPIVQEAWNEIDERAVEVLKTHLSARRAMKVKGPYGWDYTVLPEGRLLLLDDNKKNEVNSALYKVKPLVETRVSFELDRWELDNLLRGARDIDLDPLDDAVKKIALFEENAVYNGYEKAGIEGLFESAERPAAAFGKDGHSIMETLSAALLTMKEAYQDGPFTLIVGEEGWRRIHTEIQGYPLIKRVRDIIGGPILYSGAVKDALLVPQQHEDLELIIGGDFSIGYDFHDAKKVHLFIAESFTFRVIDPSIIQPFSM